MGSIEAGCHDCDWGSLARNAMGTAARHAKAHGHATWVEALYEFGESANRRAVADEVERETTSAKLGARSSA